MLPTPSTFEAFPYAQPYAIQLQLMQHLYNDIEQRAVAVLESPTGTGKSLSVLCSALQWLDDNAHRPPPPPPAAPAAGGDDDDEPEWMRAFEPAPAAAPVVVPLPPPRGPPPPPLLAENDRGMFKRQRTDGRSEDAKDDGDDDDAHLLLLDNLDDTTTNDDDFAGGGPKDGAPPAPHVQKVYYCSRTHSQLAQFLQELKRTPFAARVTVTSLGSRKNLCINDKIARPGASAVAINENCLELQRRRKTKENAKGCSFLDPRRAAHLEYAITTQVLDIEDVATAARSHRACPYYASRNTVPNAQLVVLPYQMLLHAHTRKSLGINLQEQIVIIDEAHNLIDTVADLHSATLSGRHATAAAAQLKAYIDRYKTRLLSANLVQLRILEKLLRALCASIASASESDERVLTVPQFWSSFHGTSTANVDGINLFELCTFIEKSQLSRKLRGFVDMTTPASADATEAGSSAAAMHAVEAFVHALTNSNQDGRIVVQAGTLKYLLLNPARAFADVVAQARAVVLLGGTMKPLAEFRQLLFPQVGDERFRSFECGHIVPASSVLALPLSHGPSGRAIQMTMDTRADDALITELGESLLELAKHIPDGVVCFFQKYDYAETLMQHWQTSGLWKRLAAVKQVFVEPRAAAAVDGTLSAYAQCIENGRGAMLMCVVNGKMSEGINFKDRMGRGVIVIGLPYANKQGAALKAKIDYLNAQHPRRGDEYYENLCWKAVNQSVGRAIRHKDDFAAIVLLDRRFADRTARLSNWIGQSVRRVSSFADAVTELDQAINHT